MGGLLLGASRCNDDEGDDDPGMPSEGGGHSGAGGSSAGDGDGHGNIGGSSSNDPAGVKCGTVTCAAGLVCCNASCGRCVRPGMVCTQEACDPGDPADPGDPGDPGDPSDPGDPGGSGAGGTGDPPAPSAPGCGGIAARPCPGLGSCVDDPNDSCNPRNGGADCGGVCQCEARPKCQANQKFDASPGVCACVGGEAGSGGSGGSGGKAGGEACGSVTCGDGEVCCNASCGICTKPNEGCIKRLCEPTDPPEKDPQRCGGFGGFPCPGAGECVDDPSDSCDPDNGGADCGGICKCMSGATVLCKQGTVWNSDPHVCGCAAPGGGGDRACGRVTCPEDQECCNASCGICAPKGGACIQIACL